MNKNNRDYLVIGSMLFGLFFGAGNLIFPVYLGQQAGSNMILAMLGFLITAVGLPFLGTLAMGISNSNGLLELTSKISNKFGLFFTTSLYLTIGPFFALPRLGTVAYEIGIKTFIDKGNEKIFLLLFTLIFFGLALILSLKPARIMNFVGKWLNPAFLILLSILIIMSFVNPMGSFKNQEIQKNFISFPFTEGLINGYNTMDALASLAFSIIVIRSIKDLGIDKPKEIAKYTLKSGIVTVVLMCVIYSSLVFMGTMSLDIMEIAPNGGVILNKISRHYLGFFGEVLLSLIVFLACLKTAVGLITACSETFQLIIKKIKYIYFVFVITAISFMISNIGLNSIIKLSLPVLQFLYPLAIVLILLIFLSPLFNNNYMVYKTTLLFTGLAGFLDALNVISKEWNNDFLDLLISVAEKYIPFFKVGFGWIVPFFIGFGCSYIVYKIIDK